MSEPRRWSGGAARVAEERPLGDGRWRHDALPLAFLVVVDLDPELGGDVDAVGGLQQGERQVALAGRPPQGRGAVAGFLSPAMVDVRVQRRLVARDLETEKMLAWAVLRE